MTLDALHDPIENNEILDLLLTRRSVKAKELTTPGPNAHQLDCILRAAHRVPDHKKLGPWRFIVFQGDARQSAGEHLAHALEKENACATPQMLVFEKTRFLQAPLVIAVVSSPVENEKVPEWEQILTAGAVCQNILIASNAMGYASQWLTEWYAYDKVVLKELNLNPNERIAGFIYIGTASKQPKERGRPDLANLVKKWE